MRERTVYQFLTANTDKESFIGKEITITGPNLNIHRQGIVISITNENFYYAIKYLIEDGTMRKHFISDVPYQEFDIEFK